MVKTQHESKETNMPSWIAIAISVLALIISFVALQRTENTTNQNAVVNLQDDVEQLKERQAIQNMRENLQDIREQVASGENLEQAQEDIARVRRDFRESFANARESTKSAGASLDEELGQIEQQLRDGSTDVLNSLDAFIDRLRSKVKTDEGR